MLTCHVALVTEKTKITFGELSKVAGALSKQVARDFGPIWKVNADVSPFEKLEDVPLDYWPIIVTDDIHDPSAAGYHEDKHGQPFSLVKYDSAWSLTASHECLEMLADPYGRRTVAGESPVQGQGRVNFLVEVCDPVEDASFAYTVNGVQVSDFYTPNFFDPVESPGVRYSYTGVLTKPRQVLRGGYLSWYVPSTRRWWQRTWFGQKAVDGALKNMNLSGTNVRAAIDRHTEAKRRQAMSKSPSPLVAARLTGTGEPARPFESRAEELRAAIAAVTTKARKA